MQPAFGCHLAGAKPEGADEAWVIVRNLEICSIDQ